MEPGRAYSYCTISLRTDDPTMRLPARGLADRLVMEGDRFMRTCWTASAPGSPTGSGIGRTCTSPVTWQFDADTSAGDREVDLVVRVERPQPTPQEGPDRYPRRHDTRWPMWVVDLRPVSAEKARYRRTPYNWKGTASCTRTAFRKSSQAFGLAPCS